MKKIVNYYNLNFSYLFFFSILFFCCISVIIFSSKSYFLTNDNLNYNIVYENNHFLLDKNNNNIKQLSDNNFFVRYNPYTYPVVHDDTYPAIFDNSANETMQIADNKFFLKDYKHLVSQENSFYNLPKPDNNINYESQNIVLNNKTFESNIKSFPNDFYSIKDIKTKKNRFIISILPLIVSENQKIYIKRNYLLNIQKSLSKNKTLNKNDLSFLETLALKYKINTENKHKIDIVDSLLEYVDEIPNSIVLAQAANESGWGSSRFARDFNALFGEYTYDINNGIEPSLREEGKKHLVKFFPTIHASIESYFNNINSHYAYDKFRKKRKMLRNNNLPLNTKMLVQFLHVYAEDLNYVKTINSIIEINKLNRFDNLKIISNNFLI